MTLTTEQKNAVAGWIASGASISEVQKRLRDQFKLSLTYKDTRFLIDDLGLALKAPPAPKATPPDLGAGTAAMPGSPAGGAGAAGGLGAAPEGTSEAAFAEEPAGFEDDAEFAEEEPAEPVGGAKVKVEIDRVMRPGSVVSGTVTFSDGNSGKWALDQYGRLVFDGGKSGFRPGQADLQAFQRELSAQLQRHGY